MKYFKSFGGIIGNDSDHNAVAPKKSLICLRFVDFKSHTPPSVNHSAKLRS